MRVGDQFEYGESHHGQSGAAHAINSDAPEENEAVRQLRAVVEEIHREAGGSAASSADWVLLTRRSKCTDHKQQTLGMET